MRIKYKILLLRKEFNSIRLVKTLSSSSIQKIMQHGGRAISINIEQPAYISNNTVFYFVDFESNAQLFFEEKQNCLTSEQLDMAISNKMLREIMSAESMNAKERIINMIIGAVFGAMAAGLLALLYISQSQAELMDSIVSGVII